MSNAVFTSLRTEGGLLPVDLLRRISLLDRDLPGLRGEDYGLAPGERVADAIVRSWNRLLPIWDRFAERLERMPASETSADTQTRDEWTKWLLDELGYPSLVAVAPVVIDDKSYPVSHRAGPTALHLVGARVDLDHRPVMGGRAPYSMVQEFLNRDDQHLWGIVTNGLRLQVLRDSSSLTRQAFCEFDLEAIFAGQLYSEFALCWLTCHATRLTGEPPSSCWLQQWSDAAQTEGVRALDDLRSGVEAAIELLGSGLLTPANSALRERLRSGELSTVDFQRQLLRLVYRLMFLLVAESRDLLHAPDASQDAIDRYRTSYSIDRLVTLARRQKGSLHGDLWAGLQVTFRALSGPGAPSLGLVGLGSFLWSPTSIPDVIDAVIPNRALLEAIDRLTSFETGGVRRRVDYKNLGAEELGGVYESLLELHVEVDVDGQRASLATAAGNERKTTGSYYTPTPLIRVLLDSALDPVLDEAEQADDPEAALLALKIFDPAAGSGHFLIAAANRLAHRVATVRSGDTEPSPDELRKALREVMGRSIYGVDINPMSVELCKVSLWMESTERGKPLDFLDHHIVCGNSLLGTTPALIDAGIPDEAFKALTGDDKTVVAALKKRNKAERAGQAAFAFGAEASQDAKALAGGLAEIDALPGDNAAQIEAKELRFATLTTSAEAARLRLAADAWCAALVNLKAIGEPQLTTDVVRRFRRDLSTVTPQERDRVGDMQRRYRFVHLHVAFPDVFRLPDGVEIAENERTGWSGGFSVVLGNPPWERVKLQEKEWFAVRDPSIAEAPNAAARKKMIAALLDDHAELHLAFEADLRQAEGESHLLRGSGRYPLAGRGDVNTYAVFAELMQQAISGVGRAGAIIPTGIATDDTTKHFFADLVDQHALVSLYDFENRKAIFPGVHRSYKFCLMTTTGHRRPAPDAQFVFFALGVEDLDDPERRFSLTPEDFALLNPNTRTCPVFRSGRDAHLLRAIASRVPPLVRESDPVDASVAWSYRFREDVHMAHASRNFLGEPTMDSRRLIEAKMFHQFDHRWSNADGSEVDHGDPTCFAQPRYWIAFDSLRRSDFDESRGIVAWRNITNSTNERTMIFSLQPLEAFGNSAPVALIEQADSWALVAVMNSFIADYCCRQRLNGTNLTMNILRQVNALGPGFLGLSMPYSDATVRDRLLPAVLELTYNAWDLEIFARSVGHFGPPYAWNPGRRTILRAELDALMFQLYGIERDDVDYIMETFPIVKRKDEAEFGEFLTKRLILERYDAMAEAEAAGVEYETALDPPPADPSLCHPESTRPDWARPVG